MFVDGYRMFAAYVNAESQPDRVTRPGLRFDVGKKLGSDAMRCDLEQVRESCRVTGSPDGRTQRVCG